MSSLVDDMRLARQAPSVLKVKLSNIRSKYPDVAVFVFEGAEDVGPYTVWIRRIDEFLRFESIVSNGKAQVLGFRDMLQSDRQNLRKNLYFFIDRDFDGMRGRTTGPDLYVTSKYSIENELVTTDVLRHVLCDLFQCAGDSADRDRILEQFRQVRAEFLERMAGPNLRLYRGVHLKIPGEALEESLTKYVRVGLRSATVVYSEASLKSLVPLVREPTQEECDEVDPQFWVAHPLHCRRGKFLYGFFVQWLDALGDARRNGDATVFSDGAQKRGYSREKVSMAALAALSKLPHGLAEFVARVARPVAS